MDGIPGAEATADECLSKMTWGPASPLAAASLDCANYQMADL